MRNSDYRIDLLTFIYKHPYTKFEKLVTHFKRKSQTLRLSHRALGIFSKDRLLLHVEELHREGLIEYVPYGEENCSDDTKAHSFSYPYKVDASADHNVGLLLTLKGSEVVSKYKRYNFNMWVPWGVTAFIAAVSAFFQALTFIFK